jgi:anti-sigma-K factor RskA
MRHDNQPHGPLEPQDVEELLPWYVTGRVSREEARGIETALNTMPDLADKLAQVQREREAVARASEVVEPVPPETLQRLLQQVEATRQWRVPRIEGQGEARTWLRGALHHNAFWQAAFAAACVVVVALGVRLYNPPDDSGLAGSIGKAGGATVTVRFQPAAAAADIASLLARLNASIVGGPATDGAYLVRVPAAQAAEIESAVSALASRKDLVLSAQLAQ